MPLDKLVIENDNTKARIKCMFNPTEYSISKTSDWKEEKQTGKNVPKFDYKGGGPKTLTMQLLFDAFEVDQGDVTKDINELWKFVLVDKVKTPQPKDKRSRPPLCRVQWGNHWEFKAAVTNLKVRYHLFREDGRPVRATVDVTFVEAMDETKHPDKGTNPSSHGEPGHRRRTVDPHDTLAWIAWEEYGDSGLWRAIADANQIDDPLSLLPGQVLAIPPQP
jgi:nucleoid-associated protein YgaU